MKICFYLKRFWREEERGEEDWDGWRGRLQEIICFVLIFILFDTGFNSQIVFRSQHIRDILHVFMIFLFFLGVSFLHYTIFKVKIDTSINSNAQEKCIFFCSRNLLLYPTYLEL